MYNTDKHELLGEYEKLFYDKKDKRINLLEIGIWKGGSLLWASDYFSNGKIVGIDLDIPDITGERITKIICDQNDSSCLRRLEDIHGKFDIIIDDGSHLGRETKKCFRILWDSLNVDGWYVIEDWDAYKVAPQFKAITKMAQNMLKFECKETRYFKRNKAYAAFKK